MATHPELEIHIVPNTEFQAMGKDKASFEMAVFDIPIQHYHL